ncbi:MAG: aminotransferase class I/II-fold pyridoxal phosphate-dependent enzyme, partial [Bacteroidales bacterium]
FAAAELLGARVVHFERRFEDGYALDPDQVKRAITPRTRLVVLSSLHNPSGVMASPEAIQAVGRIAEQARAHVLVDEVYLDSAFASPRTTAATLGEVFISTSSLTKAYGLSGLRCGWALASPRAAEQIRRARDIVDGVGAFPAEAIAVVAFEHLGRLAARARNLLGPNFAIVREFLDSRADLQYVAPAGGTVVFPKLRGRDEAGPFIDRLLIEEQVAVVPGRFFQSPAHFRLAFGLVSPETLRGGLERMGRVLDT